MIVRLPNLSKSMDVAHLRYIESIHEPAELRNPDTLVRHFIPMRERWRAAWLGNRELARLRADPFYYYLVARTRHYDRLVLDAVADGVEQIVNVGCGTDTRAHRFGRLLRARGVTVLECDQPAAIRAKQERTRRWPAADLLAYMPIDLNDGTWPDLKDRLARQGRPVKTVAIMEGVSPYVDREAFPRFLQLLRRTLSTGSQVAYDFKVRGVDDDFGRAGRTRVPFRLSRDPQEVIAFHQGLGFAVESVEMSAELCARLLPVAARSAGGSFDADGLVRLRVPGPLVD